MSPISNVVEDGVDGFLVRPADKDHLCQLFLDIFLGNIPTQEIGEKARKKVLDLFETDKLIHAVNDAYRNVLLRSGSYKES